MDYRLHPPTPQGAATFIANLLWEIQSKYPNDNMIPTIDAVTEELISPVEMSDISLAGNEIHISLGGEIYILTVRKQ